MCPPNVRAQARTGFGRRLERRVRLLWTQAEILSPGPPSEELVQIESNMPKRKSWHQDLDKLLGACPLPYIPHLKELTPRHDFYLGVFRIGYC